MFIMNKQSVSHFGASTATISTIETSYTLLLVFKKMSTLHEWPKKIYIFQFDKFISS